MPGTKTPFGARYPSLPYAVEFGPALLSLLPQEAAKSPLPINWAEVAAATERGEIWHSRRMAPENQASANEPQLSERRQKVVKSLNQGAKIERLVIIALAVGLAIWLIWSLLT